MTSTISRTPNMQPASRSRKRNSKQPAAQPMTVMEKAADYQKLQQRREQLHERFPAAHLHLRIDAAGQYADNIEVIRY